MYVLIAIFISANSTIATVTSEHTDLAKCNAAKAAIQQSSVNNYAALLTCAPK